jgi:phosphate butyryltransferase
LPRIWDGHLGLARRSTLPDDEAAVREAVRMFRDREAALIMKGGVSTSTLLKAVLDKTHGVPPQGILSHVTVFENPHTGKLMLLSDAAVNIRPNLQRKVEIVRNALTVARCLGIATWPRVAMLAATEKVNYPAMPATLDADLIARMAGKAHSATPMSPAPWPWTSLCRPKPRPASTSSTRSPARPTS